MRISTLLGAGLAVERDRGVEELQVRRVRLVLLLRHCGDVDRQRQDGPRRNPHFSVSPWAGRNPNARRPNSVFLAEPVASLRIAALPASGSAVLNCVRAAS